MAPCRGNDHLYMGNILIIFCVDDNQFTRTMDRDGVRAATLASRSTQVLLSPDEINELRDNALRNIDDNQRRGTALALLARCGEGHVLTIEESDALQSALTTGDPLFHAAHPIPLDTSMTVGVRDVAACKKAHDERACTCESPRCPECGACPFKLRLHSAFQPTPPSVCGKCTSSSASSSSSSS